MPKQCAYETCSNPVWGKGYCKYHQHLRKDKKPKGLSASGFLKRRATGEREIFHEIWNERERKSQLSGRDLSWIEVDTSYWVSCFAHILNKKNHKHFRLNKNNIWLLHPEEHTLFDNGTTEQRVKYAEKWDELMPSGWLPLYDLKSTLTQEYERLHPS